MAIDLYTKQGKLRSLWRISAPGAKLVLAQGNLVSKASNFFANEATSNAPRERLQNALNYWYGKALDMFGRSESKRSERYRFWGLKRRSNEQSRIQYIAEVNPLIEKLGLRVPDFGEERIYH